MPSSSFQAQSGFKGGSVCLLKYTVLIVDDSEADRFIYCRGLQTDPERNYSFLEAGTLQEGLKLWQAEQPQVLLVDLNLPDGNGLELLEAVAHSLEGSKSPVIILTGQGDERTAVQAMKLGAADYLVKGDITPVSLRTAVAQVIEHRNLTSQLSRSQKQATTIAEIALRIRQSLDLDVVQNAIVQEVQNFLQADRVIIYRFDPDMSGTIVAEAVQSPWLSCLGEQVEDTCFKDDMTVGQAYRQGRVFLAQDVDTADLTDCHRELLARFQVKANLVVPILVPNLDQALWGLLVVHQCGSSRHWEEIDVQFLQQLSVQLAIALQQAELYQQIQTFKDRLELAVKSGAIGIWDWDIINNHLTWDDRMYQLYGVEVDQFDSIYNAWLSRVHPNDRDRANQAIQQALQGEKDYDLEFRILHPDGTLRYIKAKGLVKRNAAGLPQRMTGINYDVTEEREADQALHKNAAHLRAAQRIANLGSWELEVGTSKITWSEEVFAIFGLVGLTTAPSFAEVTAMIDPDDRQIHAETVQNAIEEGTPYTLEMRIHRPDGSLRYIGARGLPLLNTAGEVVQLVGTVQDLTERKLAEQQLEAAKAAAEAANQAKSDFLALMSHEIRTPMNAILGLVYLSLQTHPPAPHRENLGKIQVAAESLLQILNDILDFSKIESGKLELETAPFALNEVLEQLTNILDLKAIEKGIELIFKVDEQVPSHLLGDSLRLRQILLNLISNGIKFTDTGSVQMSIVLLEQKTDTVKLRFEVKDTGIGMTPEQMAKLFEAFIQADLSISRRYSGTGLGLSICKRLVTLMGGTIAVDSEINQGSTFYFEIPLQYQPLDQRTQTETTPQDLQGLKVLVVEDNPVARTTLTQILDSFSFRVTSVGSGSEALNQLQQETDDPYQILLIDWCMPEMNGIETVRQIRCVTNASHLSPILMVTAYDPAHIQQDATQLGIHRILPKPFSRSQLYNAILDTLGYAPSRYLPQSPISTEQYRAILIGTSVLLVEDNVVNQEIGRELLSSVGVEVDVASMGQIALEKVKIRHYDAILMDIQMPIMDGLQATRLIRNLAIESDNPDPERFATVPIIAMTANAMISDRAKSFAAGMNDHVSKPINPQELFHTLVKWVAPETDWETDWETNGKMNQKDLAIDTATVLVTNTREMAIDASVAGEISPRETCKTESPKEFEIPNLPGLNVAKGVAKFSGKWSTYHRILQQFVNTHNASPAKLETALAQNDREQLFFLIHTLKGSTGNINAEALFEAASTLEARLKNPHPPLSLLAPEILNFSRCLQELLETMLTLSSAALPSPVDTPRDGLPADEVRSILIEINELLEIDFPSAIDRLDTLYGQVEGSLKASLMDISDRLGMFDTDTAKDLLQDLLGETKTK